MNYEIIDRIKQYPLGPMEFAIWLRQFPYSVHSAGRDYVFGTQDNHIRFQVSVRDLIVFQGSPRDPEGVEVRLKEMRQRAEETAEEAKKASSVWPRFMWEYFLPLGISVCGSDFVRLPSLHSQYENVFDYTFIHAGVESGLFMPRIQIREGSWDHPEFLRLHVNKF